MHPILEVKEIKGEQWVRWKDVCAKADEAYGRGWDEGFNSSEAEDRRFTASVAAMQGLLVNGYTHAECLTLSVQLADDLLIELDRTKGDDDGEG